MLMTIIMNGGWTRQLKLAEMELVKLQEKGKGLTEISMYQTNTDCTSCVWNINMKVS